MELHIPQSRSLKAKRSVVRPLVEGLRNRFDVAAAEVAHQDAWQRAAIGVAGVAGDAGHVTDVLDACERFVWSHPEIEVVDSQRRWMGDD